LVLTCSAFTCSALLCTILLSPPCSAPCLGLRCTAHSCLAHKRCPHVSTLKCSALALSAPTCRLSLRCGNTLGLHALLHVLGSHMPGLLGPQALGSQVAWLSHMLGSRVLGARVPSTHMLGSHVFGAAHTCRTLMHSGSHARHTHVLTRAWPSHAHVLGSHMLAAGVPGSLVLHSHVLCACFLLRSHTPAQLSRAWLSCAQLSRPLVLG
jgi:hypothetical protein